ncbi:mitochondrial import receptor subunit TOM40B [Porphyrio hochstetteri]
MSPTPPPMPPPHVQVGVELEANTRLQDTTFTFGYQLSLPRANVVFRGLLDSNWSVGGVLEKKLPPLPVTLALGAFLNHWKNRFHCGFSLIVG